MADEIIIETTSQEVIEVGVPGPQGATGPQGPAGAAGASTWNDITGKPSTFTPSAHASTHHTGGSDPITPANIGAAQAVTDIELNPNGTTTISTSQLPARGIAFIEGGGNFTVNLPTPGIRQSGLTFSIKTEHEGIEGGDVFITVVHNATTLLSAYDLPEAEGSIDFVWDGLEWSFSSKYYLATYAGRQLSLPPSSGIIALTSDIPSTFAASAITSGVLNNARINFAAPPAIGSTTPAAGSFTTLNANNGTITASAPVLDLSQTWNNAAVTFTGLRINVTNTASNSASNIIDIQVGGTTRMMLKRDGVLHLGPFTNSGFYSPAPAWHGSTAGLVAATNLAIGSSLDTILERGGAGIIEQRNLANAQTYRIYNTYTDANNHERGFMRWSSNVLQIGTEKAGTGSARALQLQTDGTTRFTFSAGGSLFIGDGSSQANNFFGWSGNGGFRAQQTSTGVITLLNWAETDFNRLQFGGTTSSFPALKRSSTVLQVRLADDSAFAPLSCGALTLNGNLDASTRDIVTDTTTGTKIGTGTTQKLGFFNATPIVRPAAIADATDAATTQARLNDLLAAMRSLGLIAT